MNIMSKVYRSYEEMKRNTKDKFNLEKTFKNQKSYDRFLKWQNFKENCRLFYWSPRKETKHEDGSIHVSFSKAKRL